MAVEELHKVVTLFCPLEKLECLGTVLIQEGIVFCIAQACDKETVLSPSDGNHTQEPGFCSPIVCDDCRFFSSLLLFEVLFSGRESTGFQTREE